MSDGVHVLFGAGQVGGTLARLLLDDGKRVRIAKRSAGGVPNGAEVFQGDASDPEFCTLAMKDAAVVYHCMNPPYFAKIWADLVPKWIDNLIGASGRAGARLVVLDNLYMLGRPDGKPLTEDTPLDPCSKKGEIRARAAERLFDAHRRGDVRATSGRASDFYGPNGTESYLGDPFWPNALAGKTAWLPLDPEAVHTYHYVPDVARALMTLGAADDDAYGRPWMLPCSPAGTLRDLTARFEERLGKGIKVGTVPGWIVKTAGLVVPLMRELQEMRYQWDEPFVVDDRRFRERFGQTATDPDEAATATVAWATKHYATAA